MASSPIVITLHAIYPKYRLTMRSIFGWLLCPPIQQKPSKSEAPSPHLFVFFSSLHLPPITMTKRPPPRIPPVRISSPPPPQPPTPLFGWLLRRSIEQKPSKTGVPPISQFFDGHTYGAPNKGTKRSAHEPGRRVRLHQVTGSRDETIWIHGGCSHGEGGQAAGR